MHPYEKRSAHEKDEEADRGDRAVERVRDIFVTPEAKHDDSADAENNICLEAGHLGNFQAKAGQSLRK
jgi:hypothetical protein